MSLAKVTFIKSVKVRCYGLQLCGSMLYQAIGGVCAVCCAEWNSAQRTAHIPFTCCHTTEWSVTLYFYRFNKCDFR